MKKPIIINAVVWASVLLACAYLFRDSPNSIYLLFIIPAGAIISNGLLEQQAKKERARDCR